MGGDVDTKRVVTAIATGGTSELFNKSWTGQSKAQKDAANLAIENNKKLLQEAKDQAASEESTATSAISRARQKALAAATAMTGRSGTIKTVSQGVIGESVGATKTLIGE